MKKLVTKIDLPIMEAVAVVGLIIAGFIAFHAIHELIKIRRKTRRCAREKNVGSNL